MKFTINMTWNLVRSLLLPISVMLIVTPSFGAFAQSQSLDSMVTYHKKSDFIKEFDNPLDGLGLKGITTDANGNAWFYHSVNNASTLVKLDPSNGKFVQYGIMGNTTVSNPISALAGGQLVFDKSRNLIWFTDARTNSIGKFDVMQEKFEFITIPTREAGPMGITMSPDGNSIWFAEIIGNNISRLDVNSNKITEYNTGENTGPAFLTFDDKEILWISLTYSHSIMRVHPDSIDVNRNSSMTVFTLPNKEPFSPFGISVITGADGKQKIFVSDHGSSRVVSADVGTDLNSFMSYWTSPSDASLVTLPGQIVADKKGNIYFPEHGGNRIAKIDTTGVMTEYDIPTGPLSTVIFLGISDDGSKVWFTEIIANKIAYLDTTIPVNFNLQVKNNNMEFANNEPQKMNVLLERVQNSDSFVLFSNLTLNIVGMTDLGLHGITYDIQPEKIDLQQNPNSQTQITLKTDEKARSGQYTIMVGAHTQERNGQLAISKLYPVLVKLDISQISKENQKPFIGVESEKIWLHDLVNLLLILAVIALITFLVFRRFRKSKTSQQKIS